MNSSNRANTSEATLKVEDTDGIRRLTLNRPERRNALDTELLRLLCTAIRTADDDPALRVILLAAEGPVFCAGADLGEFKGPAHRPEEMARRTDLIMALQLVLEQVSVPVVAAVQGAAVGAGASLAIAVDLTVMGKSARIAYPELAHGMVPSMVIAHLQRRAGRKQAFELLALGQPIDAARSLSLGLCNRVVEDAEVFATALGLAQSLAQHDRCAMRATKRIFADYASDSLARALEQARAVMQQR